MNRLLVCLSVAFVWGAATHLAAQQVSVVPQKKAALLEEYTGTGCGNCPDGAAYAARLKDLCGDAFHVISIHAGYYAEPFGDRPDFRTDFGDTLLDNAGDIGFPCGSINRVPYAEPTLNMYRASWTKATKRILAEDAVVNLYAEAEVDFQTRTLTVNVEYCYMDEVQDSPVHLLNVALVQNHIIGYQNGGGNQYSHEHMLRHLLTGQWGDTVRDFQVGEVYTRQYTYVLPENIREVDLDIRNIELVAFMAQGKRDVLNVTACKPRINGLQEDLNVNLTALTLPDNRYAYTFFPVKLQNLCNDTLTRLLFVADINGTESETEVEVCVPPYQTRTLEIPVETYAPQVSNKAGLHLSALNGKPFESEEISYSFSAPIVSNSRMLCIDMQTDNDGDEVSYRIRNRKGEVVYRKGPFEAGKQTMVNDTVVLDNNGIYCLEFLDEWHDGWQVAPKGSYKVRDGKGKLIGQNYSVTGSGSYLFLDLQEDVSTDNVRNTPLQYLGVKSVEGGFSVSNPSSLCIEGVEVYAVDGKCLYKESMHTVTDVRIRFIPATTQICIVGVRTDYGIRYFKLLKNKR